MRISDWSSDVCSSDLQQDVAREDVQVTAADLLAPSRGTITRAGFDGNVEVCVRYLAAWLDGNGCVPIHHLMEEAATAQIGPPQLARKSVAEGKSVSVRVGLGGRRIIKKKKQKK